MIAATFADPETVVVTALKAAFLGRPDEPAKISTSAPSSTLAAGTTHLQVDMESDSADDYPVTARAQVRVTVHCSPTDPGRPLVKATADTARALIAAATHEGVAGFVPSGRSAVSQDPDTKNLMCWFRVRVDLLASVLAS